MSAALDEARAWYWMASRHWPGATLAVLWTREVYPLGHVLVHQPHGCADYFDTQPVLSATFSSITAAQIRDNLRHWFL